MSDESTTKMETFRWVTTTAVYPFLIGSVIFSVGALSDYSDDHSQCFLGGYDNQSSVELKHYVLAIKLMVVVSCFLGAVFVALQNLSEMHKSFYMFLAYIFLAGNVVAFFMSIYALATTECVQSVDTDLLNKDNDVTYVSVFVTIIFALLGITSLASEKRVSDDEDTKVDASIFKLMDSGVRLTAVVMAFRFVENDKHGFAVAKDDTTSITTINNLCKDAIRDIRQSGHFVAYDDTIIGNIIIAALAFTIVEILMRVAEMGLNFFNDGNPIGDKTWHKIMISFRYVMTAVSHLLIGLFVAGTVQMALYEECEAYPKTRSFRTTLIIALLSTVTSVLAAHFYEYEQKLRAFISEKING